ncbi:MAG: hypothetical protein ACLQOO_26815, partial [Terriglobia bacterium]
SPVATHNATETTPRASKSNAGGLGEVCASSHTPTERVHGEGMERNALRLRFFTAQSAAPDRCIQASAQPEAAVVNTRVANGLRHVLRVVSVSR